MTNPTGCKKIAFMDRAAAKEWAREAQRRGAQRMRPYLCGSCTASSAWDEVWHLTRGPKTGRAKGGKRNGKKTES